MRRIQHGALRRRALQQKKRARIVPAATALTVISLIAVGLTACGSSVKDDPLLRLSAEEALQQGTELFEAEKYAAARRYLTQAFEIEPNSRSGREALLMAADAYFFQGGEVNFVQAEAKYRDFLNRFPTSDRGDYVQFQIASALSQRIGKPNRDQGTTRQTLEAYQLLRELYPTSDYASQAAEQIQIVRQQLAEHEFIVGEFYLKTRNPPGAVGRFEGVLERFPEYDHQDKVLYHLVRAYEAMEESDKAEQTRARLREEYPDSEYSAKL